MNNFDNKGFEYGRVLVPLHNSLHQIELIYIICLYNYCNTYI